MDAVCAKVDAANKLEDPLAAFPAFKKYDRNGYALLCTPTEDLFSIPFHEIHSCFVFSAWREQPVFPETQTHKLTR